MQAVYNGTTSKWTQGITSKQQYKTGSNSGLAAMYHECAHCSNKTVLAFQDPSDAVLFAKTTDSGWQAPTQPKNVVPLSGTALALHPFTDTGVEDSINLYYQGSDLGVYGAQWTEGAPSMVAFYSSPHDHF